MNENDKEEVKSLQANLIKRYIRAGSKKPNRRNALPLLASTKFTLDSSEEKALFILNKRPYQRTPKEDKKLKTYILNSSIFKTIKDDLNIPNIPNDHIASVLSQTIEVLKPPKSATVYSFTEKQDSIYYLMKGSIKLSEIIEEEILLSPEEYYMYLYEISSNKNKETVDNILLAEIIECNSNQYRILHQANIYMFKDIVFKHKILLLLKQKQTKESDEEIINLFKQYQKKYEFYNFDKVLDNYMTYDKCYKQIKSKIIGDEVYYMNNIENSINENNNKKLIKNLSYVKVKEQSDPSFFGDYPKEHKGESRNHTVHCLSDCILLEIKKNNFIKQILYETHIEREKLKEKIKYSCFFRSISRVNFSKDIFKYFQFNEYNNGAVVFKENKIADTLYIIQEGTISLTINNESLLNIRNLMNQLNYIDANGTQLIDIDTSSEDNFKQKIPYKVGQQLLNQKRNYLLLHISNTLIEEWEYYFKREKYSYTARVISDKAKIYSLAYDRLDDICSEEKKGVMEDLKVISYIKVKAIIEVCIEILDSFYKKFSSEFSRDLILQERILNSDTLRQLSEKNQVKAKIIERSYCNTVSFPSNQIDHLPSPSSIMIYPSVPQSVIKKRIVSHTNMSKKRKMEDIRGIPTIDNSKSNDSINNNDNKNQLSLVQQRSNERELNKLLRSLMLSSSSPQRKNETSECYPSRINMTLNINNYDTIINNTMESSQMINEKHKVKKRLKDKKRVMSNRFNLSKKPKFNNRDNIKCVSKINLDCSIGEKESNFNINAEVIKRFDTEHKEKLIYLNKFNKYKKNIE